MNDNFAVVALEKFEGCDSDERAAGTPENPSVWLLGLEHGTFKSIHEGDNFVDEDKEEGYSVKTQLRWPYNRAAFKLLAAMHGHSVEDYISFAERERPFVEGSPGYFKGNLYPYPCRKLEVWTEEAISDTGFASKAEYQTWCHEKRLPVVKQWIDEHQPKLIIGAGISNLDDFALAVFGEKVDFQHKRFETSTQTKRVAYFVRDGRKLLVVPHLSGGPNGLNSDASLQQVGKFARMLLNSRDTTIDL